MCMTGEAGFKDWRGWRIKLFSCLAPLIQTPIYVIQRLSLHLPVPCHSKL